MSPAHGERATQEQRRTEAERRLLEAAAELIGEVGPAKITLAGIGERAGYSRGLATHHFGSKSAVLQRLVDSVTEQFSDAVLPPTDSTPGPEQVLGLVDFYFQILADLRPMNRARLVLWADAIARDSEDIRPAMAAADRLFLDEITRTLTRAVTAGTIPKDVRPAGLATVIVAMLRGVALEYLMHDTVDLAGCRSEIEQLLRGRLGVAVPVRVEI